jgi:hypothetical protein
MAAKNAKPIFKKGASVFCGLLRLFAATSAGAFRAPFRRLPESRTRRSASLPAASRLRLWLCQFIHLPLRLLRVRMLLAQHLQSACVSALSVGQRLLVLFLSG